MKNNYVSPMVEVIPVEVERGFAASQNGGVVLPNVGDGGSAISAMDSWGDMN